MRHSLPDERRSITHGFEINSVAFGRVKCHVTVGLYDDGSPGEIFARMNCGSSVAVTTASVLLDQWAIGVSLLLQNEVPIGSIVAKFRGVTCEPRGWTASEQIHSCLSPVDYIAKWLDLRFCNETEG